MKNFAIGIFILYCCFLKSAVNAKLTECTEGYVRCADNTKCIPDSKLCDFNLDCNDHSDERIQLCKILHQEENYRCNSRRLIHVSNSCYGITSACKFSHDVLSANQHLLCQEIEQGLKPPEEYATLLKEKPNLEEFFDRLATSFNESTRIKNDSTCPPLYVDVGSKCVAIFLVAEVTWTEAKQFCESISGTLAIIRKVKDYEALLKHLKTHDLGSNFWIGGKHKTKPDNTSSWTWLDEKDIIMGAPYWSVYHSTTCTLRENSDHCYVYDISPREHTDGYCLAMDYEFHYYFTDSNCFEKRNPLCYLDEK